MVTFKTEACNNSRQYPSIEIRYGTFNSFELGNKRDIEPYILYHKLVHTSSKRNTSFKITIYQLWMTASKKES